MITIAALRLFQMPDGEQYLQALVPNPEAQIFGATLKWVMVPIYIPSEEELKELESGDNK